MGKSVNSRLGMAFIYSLSVGFVLLLLGTILYRLVTSHHKEIQLSRSSISARFLAETGIGMTVRAFRETVEAGDQSLLNPLLSSTQIGKLRFDPTQTRNWDYNLASIKMIDANAALIVTAELRDFAFTETDSSVWKDPIAKKGILCITSKGVIGTISHEITSERSVTVLNSLPPLSSKFTLRLHNNFDRSPGRFNKINNNDSGQIPPGNNRPLVLLNHICSDNPLPSEKPSVINDPENVWAMRGWIWFGGGDSFLQISAGDKEQGESFILEKNFLDGKGLQPIEYTLASLPSEMISRGVFPRDIATEPLQVEYQFGLGYTFYGTFSGLYRENSDLLAGVDAVKYPDQSSFLHLFGDTRDGFNSHTKVLGRIFAGFPRISRLQVSSTDQPTQASMQALGERGCIYYLPYFPQDKYTPASQIKMYQSVPPVGGPVIKYSDIFPGNYSAYANQMCKIYEYPYAELYNFVAENVTAGSKPGFPPRTILAFDEGSKIELKRGNNTIYSGPVICNSQKDLLETRVQVELISIEQFWKKFVRLVDGKYRLTLNSVIRIRNPKRETFSIPPEKGNTLVVDGGGTIILDYGDIDINGVQIQDSKVTESLTVVSLNAQAVTFEDTDYQHVNIIAPSADLKAYGKMNLYGFLEIGDIPPESVPKGGYIRYRETLDPTRSQYENFYKICIGENDEKWID
ncbi:MAG: hypothetical protein HQM08_14185 [Candidatus Riflebacteria bacterium]|nr:hypothetical protein [Candidatus Riflebacteria bacterium]